MSEFAVGQKVTIYSHYGGPLAFGVVASVGKLKMKLGDGSEWKANGSRTWGDASRYYTGNRVWPVQDGDVQKIQRARALRKINSVKWEALDTETLMEVVDALSQPSDT